MTCMPGPCDGNTGGSPPPSMSWPGMLAEEVHSRQAAVLYLKAAAMTDDAGVRQHLRRRAAQLITTPPDRRPLLDS